MSDKYTDKGRAGIEGVDEVLNWVLPEGLQTHLHNITDGSHERQVVVNPGQTVGEAIANGQWKD